MWTHSRTTSDDPVVSSSNISQTVGQKKTNAAELGADENVTQAMAVQSEPASSRGTPISFEKL